MKIKIASALALLSVSSLHAIDKIVLEDYDYTLSGTTQVTLPADYIAAYWGTYNSGVFTPITGVNNGYFALSGDDSLVSYSATSNVNLPVTPVATLLALGFYDVPDGTAFNTIGSNASFAVLTDPAWLAVVLSTSPGTQSYVFTPNTTALKGSFSFNGGNEIITLAGSVIPEPSAAAALGGLIALGAVAARRRRSA